jgi:anaerobic dimethyl sulfoxide reductase subunit B (iron-sulfur subunit)
MQMCNLCLDRWAQNKKPICVASCPTRALDAGPLEELKNSYGDTAEADGFTFEASIRPSAIFRPKKYRLKLSAKPEGDPPQNRQK